MNSNVAKTRRCISVALTSPLMQSQTLAYSHSHAFLSDSLLSPTGDQAYRSVCDIGADAGSQLTLRLALAGQSARAPAGQMLMPEASF